MADRKKLVITPDRVRTKIRECSFFFGKMDAATDRPAEQSEEFGFYLSAFLSSLKSIEYLAPLADPKRRTRIKNEISQLRNNHASLGYLLKVRDAEVHREGAKIVMDFVTAFKLPQGTFRFPSAKQQFEGSTRFQGRFVPRYNASRFNVPRLNARRVASIYQPQAFYRYTWVFPENARDVVHTCRDSLNALIQQVNTSLGL